MRIEVDDEAARLRRRTMPTQCDGEPKVGSQSCLAQQLPLKRHSHAAGECPDCGNHIIDCRCNPGEG